MVAPVTLTWSSPTPPTFSSTSGSPSQLVSMRTW
jgi:hypothetical protein